MNWVAGVRSRLKLKSVRRQQEEFFDKRRFQTTSRNKCTVSQIRGVHQDVEFFQTLMNKPQTENRINLNTESAKRKHNDTLNLELPASKTESSSNLKTRSEETTTTLNDCQPVSLHSQETQTEVKDFKSVATQTDDINLEVVKM